jgi:hypothetical protein
MQIKRTNRGFELVEFTDAYGLHCSLQQSSLAEFEPPGSSAIWLGPEESRMHLKLEQVKELNALLSNWIETCSFEENKYLRQRKD